jgi:FKBP-type peptidyl-prolyl cis-trans isomerase FkpA
MKTKFVLALMLLTFSLAGCKKSGESSCTPVNPSVTVPSSQLLALQEYLAVKGLTGSVVRHSTDFYYKIESEGTGVNPTTCSQITVTYRGMLTDNTVFTSTAELTNPNTFPLAGLITGWQFGLQLIKKGGKITLYLPPAHGYGTTASGSIPANSILIFEISLTNVTG